MKKLLVAAVAALGLLAADSADAQTPPKIKLAMSGWTGFAPLTLAEKADLFKKHGVDVEIVFIPQASRLAAFASGSVQAVATTVDTQILWHSTFPLTQVLVLDNSNGGDGIATRAAINSIADLKGKSVAVDGAGTTPYFVLAYILKRNGLTMRDVTLATLGPQAAAQAFLAGQFDAASTYEPYLGQIRANPASGKVLATTVDYPIVVDTVAFPAGYARQNPAIVRGVVNGFFDALELMKNEPQRANTIMGQRVNQSAEQFAASAQFIRWLDRAQNVDYFATKMGDFLTYAAQIQLEAGVIRAIPDLKAIVDDSFVK